jgi:hypothetical protein
VAHFPIFTFDIQWCDLFTGHVVADLSLFHPRLRINLIQLRTEYADKVPLSKKGWQDATESIYPFKINHFTTVFSQVKIRRGEMKGYVKPLFCNVKVYDPAKDKNKSVLHQAYEMAVGAAAKAVKNSSTQKVATKIDVSGKLDNPSVSTWQALVQFVQNGFVNVLPGFDRQTKETAHG